MTVALLPVYSTALGASELHGTGSDACSPVPLSAPGHGAPRPFLRASTSQYGVLSDPTMAAPGGLPFPAASPLTLAATTTPPGTNSPDSLTRRTPLHSAAPIGGMLGGKVPLCASAALGGTPSGIAPTGFHHSHTASLPPKSSSVHDNGHYSSILRQSSDDVTGTRHASALGMPSARNSASANSTPVGTLGLPTPVGHGVSQYGSFIGLPGPGGSASVGGGAHGTSTVLAPSSASLYGGGHSSLKSPHIAGVYSASAFSTGLPLVANAAASCADTSTASAPALALPVGAAQATDSLYASYSFAPSVAVGNESAQQQNAASAGYDHQRSLDRAATPTSLGTPLPSHYMVIPALAPITPVVPPPPPPMASLVQQDSVAVSAGSSNVAGVDPAQRLLEAGHQCFRSGQYCEALAQYEAALECATTGWCHDHSTVPSLLNVSSACFSACFRSW